MNRANPILSNKGGLKMDSFFRHQLESLIYPILAAIGLLASFLLASPSSAFSKATSDITFGSTLTCTPPINCDLHRPNWLDTIGDDCNRPYETASQNPKQVSPLCNMGQSRHPFYQNDEGSVRKTESPQS
jgi:hypothetical protein